MGYEMNDLISVIIPVYNVDKDILDRCINSIINQTYKNLEIIMIDDGSVEQCARECDSLAATDSRIVLIHQENKGISGATNAGINIARGDFIGFSDCDDYMEPEMYEVLYRNLIDNDVDISMAGYRTVYPDGSVKLREYFNQDMKLNRNEAMYELLDNKYIISVVWNKLFRKELWENIRFREGTWFEDCVVMHQLFYAAQRGIYCSKERFYNYYQRKDSVMNSRQLVNVEREIRSWETRLAFVRENIPELSVKAEEKIIKLAIKGLLNPDYHKDISRDEYFRSTEHLVQIVSDVNTEAIVSNMPKYKKDYSFVLKYKYCPFAKGVYEIKKRIFG